MPYFTTGRVFLTPSFDLEAKEIEKIDRFLAFLESSGVGSVIARYVNNRSPKGGRPNCNYYRLFATILFGFAFDRCTLRELELACRFDLRYIALMEQTRVDHTTISKFINKVIVPNEHEIFSLVCAQVKKDLGIEFSDAFIDGTKYEANCNKYKFVWKPTAFHERISAKAYGIISDHSLLPGLAEERLIRSSTIAKAITSIQERGDELGTDGASAKEALSAMLAKVLEYEEKERICGSGRKSYYKTDRDATAMCLKADYYSGLGTNMHAAYNVQALVIGGVVFSYYVSQSRDDCDDFAHVLDRFHASYGAFPQRVCADAGYGTLRNYRYLSDNSIENYVKNQSWEGSVSGTRPDAYTLNADGTVTCLNGNVGREVAISGRHPKKANAVFFKVEGCNSCAFMPFCKRFMREQGDDFKIFEVIKEFQRYKNAAWENLLSPKGIEIRVNRSIQVEGVFGIVKQDYGRRRYNRRGMERVSAETMLYFLGLNVSKLFRFFATGKKTSSWVAPIGLKPQEMKKPSAKKLSKKGKRQNLRQYQ